MAGAIWQRSHELVEQDGRHVRVDVPSLTKPAGQRVDVVDRRFNVGRDSQI